jgi:2,3-bisphosphoglycerate-dependent phosphoglycerate mutase
MTELLLIRHGETDWNRRQCFQGHLDVPLNERGLAQAERLGARLAAERFDALVVSDLLRTRQTAAPLAAQLKLLPDYTPTLREQAFGILEGLTFDDIRVKHPAEFALWAKHEPDYALPGGAESRTLFHRRVTQALSELATRHPGQHLAVVTHGGVLDMVWRTAKGLGLQGPRECLIPNTGINRVRVKDGGFEILGWAEDEHVRDLGD